MSAIRLAILGIGSLRCGPAIIASLGTYFGERPLEVCLYDPDSERAELFQRLARAVFLTNRATHLVALCDSPKEALESADRAVVCLDPHGARRWLRGPAKPGSDRWLEVEVMDDDEALAFALPTILEPLDEQTALLSLLNRDAPISAATYYHLEWPEPPPVSSLAELPHQILRWVRGDDLPYALLEAHERSPLKAWLENVESAAQIRRG